MGCFNNHGFYSHLPIEHGDDIVLIPCYYLDYSGKTPECLSPSTIGGTLLPLSFPLFGKYNDYGFIEDVEENFNTDALIKTFGVDNIIGLLETIECLGRTDSQYIALKEVMKGNNEYSKHEAEPIIKLMERLQNVTMRREWTNKYTRFTYVIELKSVYEKMASLENIENSKYWGKKNTNSQSWDIIAQAYRDYPNILKGSNILTIGDFSIRFNVLEELCNLEEQVNTETNEEKKKELEVALEKYRVTVKNFLEFEKDLLDSMTALKGCKNYDCGKDFDTHLVFDEIDLNLDDINLKKYFFDFLGFLRYISNNGGYLTESSYGCQEVMSYSERTLKYKEFEVKILKEKIKEYKYRLNEEEYDEEDC